MLFCDRMVPDKLLTIYNFDKKANQETQNFHRGFFIHKT